MSDKLLPLTPMEDLDPDVSSYQPYRTHLDRIFRDSSLRNIGIIGNRGSGKSSILRTYDANRKKHGAFLFVSLIDFEGLMKDAPKDKAEQKPSDQNNTGEGSGNDQNEEQKEGSGEMPREQIKRNLEYSLLCQILAKCSPEDLRGSTLQGVPAEPADFKPFPLLLASFFSLCFGLIFEERVGVFLRDVLKWSMEWRVGIHAFLYGLLFLLVFGLSYFLLRAFLPVIRLKSLSVKLDKAEAVVEMEAGKYCLDHYKFEIIHILDRIGEDIDYTVVFEDMERLDPDVCINIMTKLRELNVLLHAHRSRKASGKNVPPIRFLYVLSDEIFDAEARLKFFDITVPVIPALNHENFAEKFLCLLQMYDVDIGMDTLKPLAEILCPYLPDFRMVRNIASEFLLFRDICLDNLEPGKDHRMNDLYQNLLALCACRTLYPREFAKVFCTGKLPDSGSNSEMKKLIDSLTEKNYLDLGVFSTLCLSICQLDNQKFQLLKTANSKVKTVILDEYREAEDYCFQQVILKERLLFRETDPDVITALGRYLIPLTKWYDTATKTYPGAYRDGKPLTIEECTNSFNTLLDDLLLLDPMEIPMAVTNLLLALNACSRTDIPTVLDQFPRKQDLPGILLYCVHAADFSNPPAGMYPHSGTHLLDWDELWKVCCAEWLVQCLGGDTTDAFEAVKDIRFGSKTLGELLRAQTPAPAVEDRAETVSAPEPEAGSASAPLS